MGECFSQPLQQLPDENPPQSSEKKTVRFETPNAEVAVSAQPEIGTPSSKAAKSPTSSGKTSNRMLNVIGVQSQNVGKFHPIVAQSLAESKKSPTKKEAISSKVSYALSKKVNELRDKPPTFERILLKSEKLSSVLKDVKTIFNDNSSVDGQKNSGLDLGALERALQSIDVQMTLPEVKELFGFVDLDGSKTIDLKEFLVCLTVGMVLNKIPAFNESSAIDSVKPSPVVSPTSPDKPISLVFQSKTEQIQELLNLIISAYLLFDTQGEGFIRRTAVEQIIEEQGHKSGSSAILSGEKWNQLDWDKNGTIDFAEFVLTFSSWVDIYDIMDSQETDENT